MLARHLGGVGHDHRKVIRACLDYVLDERAALPCQKSSSVERGRRTDTGEQLNVEFLGHKQPVMLLSCKPLGTVWPFPLHAA